MGTVTPNTVTRTSELSVRVIYGTTGSRDSARGRTFANAIEQVHNAWEDAYADRRKRKRNFRQLWIVRINAAARRHGLTYSKLVTRLKAARIGLDRKVLADLALSDPGGFKAVLDAAT